MDLNAHASGARAFHPAQLAPPPSRPNKDTRGVKATIKRAWVRRMLSFHINRRPALAPAIDLAGAADAAPSAWLLTRDGRAAFAKRLQHAQRARESSESR